MYKERMFGGWIEGILYMVIEVVMPIFPILIYKRDNGTGDSYLYVLLLTVIVTFLYEMIKFKLSMNSCSRILFVEMIISVCVLAGMLLATLYLLLGSHGDGSGITETMKNMCSWIIRGFWVPVVVTIIEIGRAICYHYNMGASMLNSDNQNIARGASNV